MEGLHPTPRITRVGKLDAELLDQELVQVLQDPLAKALSLANVRRNQANYLRHAIEANNVSSAVGFQGSL